jgi:bifunctional non-homologous end joining protein LigD
VSDPLGPYREKRVLDQTPEPGPIVPARAGPLAFVVQLHRATRLHFDLRLELSGVLKSWACPKGLSTDPDDKHLAVLVEDHPFDYLLFEGVIPPGQYGAGEVIVWDTGIYQPDEPAPMLWAPREEQEAHVARSLEEGKLSFRLRGKRLKGSWTLVRMKDHPNWLVIKHADQWARPNGEAPRTSAISGVALEALKAGALPPETHDLRTIEVSEKEDLPPVRPLPMLAASADQPFRHKDWFFEPKLDGVRALAIVRGPDVRLLSRNGLDISAPFPEVTTALREQGLRDAILDGEIVAFDAEGRPSWYDTIKRLKQEKPSDIERERVERPCVYFCFDVLRLEGVDMARFRLVGRRAKLEQILMPHPQISLVSQLAEDGVAMYAACLEAGFEGAMAKRRDGRYEMGRRSESWLKLKRTLTGEYVVGGWTEGEGARAATFGALMLGAWDDEGRLVYVGNVGSGFSETALQETHARLIALKTDVCPFAHGPPDKGTWTRPSLVVEVRYAEVSPNGALRSPTYLRSRDDADPAQARLGTPSMAVPVRADSSAELIEALEALKASGTLDVEGRPIALTNLDKTLWPVGPENARAVTKRDLIRYLIQVSGYLLPHIRDRALTMIRMPHGTHGERFFQRHNAPGTPDFVETIRIESKSGQRDQSYLMANNLATLIWLGQMACVEIHVTAARFAKEPDGAHLSMHLAEGEETDDRSILNYPDFLCLDLDPYTYRGTEAPGEEPLFNPAGFAQARAAAFRLKELLEQAGLVPFVKTTGKTGLHVFAPLQRTFASHEVRSLAETICRYLEREMPEVATTEWQVERRKGKVFLDYSINGRARNLAAAYTPRSTPGAWVSTPVTWSELSDLNPEALNIWTIPQRLKSQGDPWAAILESKRRLDLGR